MRMGGSSSRGYSQVSESADIDLEPGSPQYGSVGAVDEERRENGIEFAGTPENPRWFRGKPPLLPRATSIRRRLSSLISLSEPVEDDTPRFGFRDGDIIEVHQPVV